MKLITGKDINGALTYSGLIEALRTGFKNLSNIEVPPRHHHSIERPGSSDATLLLMPAWTRGTSGYVGVKLVSVFPGNSDYGLPAVLGSYVLSSSKTGEPLAVMDGTTLTHWRTACASALASDYLSRRDASVLLVVGAGALAPHLVRAHLAVRPSVHTVLVWNRTHSRAIDLVTSITNESDGIGAPKVESVEDLEKAVKMSDIISCATMSCKPLIFGKWLKDGSHVDLVGGFKRDMREADDEVMLRARVFVDTPGAMKEAGDLWIPISMGTILESDISGDLSQLASGLVKGRLSEDEVTLFKSVGFAMEDLVAAQLVYETLMSGDSQKQ